MKYTPPDHIDYENITKCYKKLQEVAEYVNEMKRSSESVQKMVEIQDALTDAKVVNSLNILNMQNFQLIAPARQFIREATFIKINSRGKQQERFVFLFNDIILYVKMQGFKRTSYQFKGSIPLNCCLVNELPDTEGTFILVLSLSALAYENAFEVVRMDETKKKYIFCASSPQEKAVWLKDLNRIVDGLLEQMKGKYNPLTRREKAHTIHLP